VGPASFISDATALHYFAIATVLLLAMRPSAVDIDLALHAPALVGIAEGGLAIGAVIINVALVHAPALVGVADAEVAVISDVALNLAPALVGVADAPVAVVALFHAPALVGVADAEVTVVIVVAHHAPAVVRIADIIIPPRTSIVRGTGAEAEVVVAEAFGTDAASAALVI